jgi:uncharacterized membrane protein
VDLAITKSPQLSQQARLPLIVWTFVTAIALALIGLIIGAPILGWSGHPEPAFAIYKTFSFVCHQIPERSFHIAGYKFAVCSRCTGIYSGFALAALTYPLMRSWKQIETPSLVWLLLAAIPLAVDFSLGYFSIWQNNHASRFATGALFGSASVFYILLGLIDWSYRLRSTKKGDA